uniref:HEPN domain-containing protein n=1 Tax=Astyanax mexicanus TaxID=7994 RepID=A0A3B1K9U9_ASTMX
MSLSARKRKKKNAFGATTPPFIDYLKEILRRYPDGGQILKELIQNADDAEASKIVFTYDERTYGTDSVWSEALGKYQGPALYAYNDAVFTEEDWKGIQQVGRSIKQEDPTKVGRFGIGFNSIYHVTDLPCVFSSKHLAVFDPQKKMFDDEQEGYRWSLDDEEDRKHLLEYTDQFKPFQDIVRLVCDCSWEKIISEQDFRGTLFRFPLRSEASEISDNLYDSSKVTQLFSSFIADAEISLLFLRKVSSISLVHIDTNGSVNVRKKVSVTSPASLLPAPQEGFETEFLKGKTNFKTVFCFSSSEPETKMEWLVTTSHLTEGRVPEIHTLAEKLSFLPQVDIAFQCDEVRTCDTGRLSCFLPLPNNETNNTGLPVHVNACFGLTDNRRYIKWQEEDQKNDELAAWNELLKKEVLPHVYLKMISDAVQLCRNSMLPASTVYSLWPDLSKTEHNKRWHEVALDVFMHLFQSTEVFSLAENQKNWVAASESVFPTNNTDTDVMSAVSRLLIANGENLVTVTDHVLKAVETVFPEPATLKWVTPGFVRNVLRRAEIGNVCRDDRLLLLDYILSDGKYEELHGLQLIPLSDGSFRSFTNKDEDTVLIDNKEFSRALLPFCKERFLPADLNRNTIQHFRQMALTNADSYKIIDLDAESVASFAKNNLPIDWMKAEGHVKWNPDEDGHPPKTWLTEFWKFLHFHCEDLSSFIGMPLIPLEPLQKTGSSALLARLERNSTLIFQSSRDSSLPDQIQNVIKMVGGTVIKKDECLRHHDIESYVLTASPKNVLQVLLNSDTDKVISSIASASLHEKEDFKMYISSLDLISDAERRLLSVLPLFRLMSATYVGIDSKQAVILKSNPAIPTDLPVPETIVQCANEADRRILTLLNVNLLDAAQLAVHLVDYIKTNGFNKEEEQKIMTWILTHGNVLLSQSEELLRKTKNLRFIETEQGERKQPSSVFDPTNKTFQDLLDEDFFPPPVYRTTQILQSLRQLGLRTKEEEISSEIVLHVASQIQKLSVHSQNIALQKADALVSVLNRNDLPSNFSEEERRQLLRTQWVPCENPCSINSNSQKKCLYKPVEIRALIYLPIVGHVMPLSSELSDDICRKLDLFDLPPAKKVLENLSVLGSLVPVMVNPDSDYEFKNKLHSTYRFMQQNIEYFREEMTEKSLAWLWCQNDFVSPQDVVLSYPRELDLSLYIKKVPHEFLQYADMLKEFGVKETLSDEEIEDIFHDIKRSIDGRSPPYGEQSELKVLIAILDWMRKNEKPLKDSTPVPVRAQNGNFTLQPLKNTVFCDLSDEGLDDLRHDQEEFHVIHEEILGVTAKWLKTPLLSTRILKPQIITAEELYPGIEQCGQTEPITQRIKNILKDYDEESDIFKELLQNAEDAKASTCGFLLDFRTHPAEGLIDDGMSLCNGPCLWSFNNELFSDEDWKNIVRVGSASKENNMEKIGKFGLGFNAVYHLTDIPSILSGKRLLIFDPNVTHLEKHIHSKSNPGIKLDLLQERLFRWFPGQFRSYQGVFGCDLAKSSQNVYNGTLIKLPFRTQEEACKSEISCKVFDKEHMNAFQKHFTDEVQSALLFLKNIRSVSLQMISEDASTPPLQNQTQALHKISTETVCSIEISNETHVQAIRNALENLDPNCHRIVDCFAAHIAETVHEHVERTNTQYWFLYSCIGTKNSLHMFQREIQDCKFSLPVGGVAAPLQREAHDVWSPDKSCEVGQAFCFLPLPIETGLPVHINGSFAVTSNRKALWQSGIKWQWNKALLQDANSTAYVTTLLELKKMAQDGKLQNYDYHTFWPDAKKVNKAFQPMVAAFYSAITHPTVRCLELFSNGQTWCSIDNVRFLDPSIENNKAVGDLAMKVFLSNAESGYCAVPLPSWVRNSFIHCGFHETVTERTFHWVEFYQVVFKNLSNMDPHCRNALILNALDLNDPDIDELLKSNPCIPTQKTDKLQFINKLVHPHGKVACLFEPEEGRFLDGTKNDYFSPKRILRLSSLGMVTGSLTLEEIVERAKTIPRVWTEDKKKAQKCLQCLFDCMNEYSNVRSPHWEKLKHIPFLPAVGTDLNNRVLATLKKPSEVYSHRHYYLVSMSEFTVDHSNLLVQPDHPVLETLEVNRNPLVETVLKQLKEAHNHSESFEKSVVFNVAKSLPFVFIEDKFVNVWSVAKSRDFEEKPYLFSLPAIFSRFENLWTCVGIKSHFTTKQFVTVLEKISTLPGPLSNSDLQTCLSILTKGLYQAKAKVKDCLLPDEKGVLTVSSKLKYNDSPWMPVQAGVNLCHKLVPRSVACHFGVETTRHHTLNNHLVGRFSPLTQEFGQHEKLTVRIKNIIEAYPSKKDILKELIQNADDAEATEIHFIWDKRKHKTEKIFGEKWKLLQGPALCVYNNKPFSNDDLNGIQQLGEGGKHGTLGRTGKYGLGFNSVYQLTDCPSILTGDKYLCISDPHLQYVEEGKKESPGCMYSLDEDFKESFNDVYHTFLPEKFALSSGTMFRLPLRTEAMAMKSDISTHVTRDDDMKALLWALIEDPEGLILFLKHITKIQFHVIDTDGSELGIFLIEKNVTEGTQKVKDTFYNHVCTSLKSGHVIPRQTVYEVQISTGKKQSHWVVAEQFGPDLQHLQKGRNCSDLRVPQVAVAACISTNHSEEEFTGRAFCSLPLPDKTGLPVHVNGNFEVDYSRRDLWKEDEDSFRIAWNQFLKKNALAPLYALLLNHLCAKFKTNEPNSLTIIRSQLDFCFRFFPFVSKKVAQGWHEMIHQVYRSISNQNLPVIPTVRSVVDDHSYLSQSKYKVTWSSVSKQDISDLPHFMMEHHEHIFKVLERIGMNLVPCSWTMEKLKQSFINAGVEVAKVSPSSVISYLKRKTLNDPSQTSDDLPLPVSRTLIKDAQNCSKLLNFCLTNVNGSRFVDLDGLPLLLTQDQVLRKFNSDSPKLISRFTNIFLGYESVFANFSVNSPHMTILQEGNYIQKLSIPVAAKILKPVLQHFLQNSSLNQRNGLYSAGKEMITWLKELWKFFCIQDRNAFCEIKKHFFDWPIVPVTSPSQTGTIFLQKISNLQSVVSDSREYISSILLKLGFTVLARTFFTDLGDLLYKCVDPELLDTGDTTAVLQQLNQVPPSQFKVLSSADADEMQHFLQSGIIRCFRNRDTYQKMLMSLPLFETIFGTRQRIDLHKNVFILKTEYQERFPDLYNLDDCNGIFLKNSFVNSSLSESLKIRILGDLEYCVLYLLPSVHKLQINKLHDLVKLVVQLRQNRSYENYRDRIVSTLQHVKFVQDIHGDLQMASYFFDDKVNLYRVMLPKERFVPKAFWEMFSNTYDETHSDLCKFHRAFAQERDVVAIKGSLLERDVRNQCLIWTAMPILPSGDCTTKHLNALKCGGAFDEPPSGQVMQNLKNICRAPCTSAFLISIRAAVFNILYAHLQSEHFNASVLANLPLILTENDTQLVKASQAVLCLQNSSEFRPYLYPIQGKHAIYAEFFKKIGVEEKPTFAQLCTVLQEIYTDCCDKNTLQPNQQKTVQRAVQQLFSVIKEEPRVCKVHRNTLYLPSTDGKLYESSTLYFNDTVFQAKRLEDPLKEKLKMLEKLNRCHLGNDQYEHQKLLQRLPQNIRPKLLSQVIYENLVGGHAELCEYRQECEFRTAFEKRLSSRAFRHGLICLIREQSKGSISQTDAARMCDSIFGKIQIICCRTLQTELLLNKEPLEGTKSETQVYVNKQQDGCTFYLQHNDNMALKVMNEVNMHLTTEINGLLENNLKSSMLPIIGQLLLCDDMEDVERIMEKNGIHNSVSEEGGFSVRPNPGSPIPEEWLDSLDMNPLNSFEKGEYVGFRRDESKDEYFFAIIVECLDEEPGQIRRNPSRYRILIGKDEFIDVSSLDLYQFKRERRSGPVIYSSCREIAIISEILECMPSQRRSTPRTPEERPIQQTLEEVKREIDRCLEEIWKMSNEDKHKAIRRLYLKWHPDKNLDNPDLANMAFKYLKDRIEELQRGHTERSTSSSCSNFRDYWSTWNDEARTHRRGRQQFHQNNSRQQYNFWSYYRQSDTPRPDREQAKRWNRQAACDLLATEREIEESPEWCLFKVHQAVEKALIASEYRKNGRHPGNCSITSLAQQVSHYSPYLSEVPSAVAQLRTLGVDAKKTQYPNLHPSPRIPHEQFKSEEARQAVNTARNLLINLHKYITE